MLSANVLKLFSHHFDLISCCEKDAQTLKSLLSKLMPNSKIFEFLKSFGPHSHNRTLTAENIHFFLNKNNTNRQKIPEISAINHFVKSITISGIIEISLKDFTKWMNNGKGNDKEVLSFSNVGFSLELMTILKKLLLLEVKNSVRIFQSFEEIKQIPGFNLYLIFEAFLPRKKDNIAPQNLKSFLRTQEFKLDNFEYLQNRLFEDKEELNYREFSLFFSKIGGLDTQIQIKSPPSQSNTARGNPNDTSFFDNKTYRNSNFQINSQITQKIQQINQPNFDRRSTAITPQPNKRNHEEIVKRKKSYDYVEYLLKVRNTEAKLQKIRDEIPKKMLNCFVKKSLDAYFFELLQSQLKIEKEIESVKEDLALRSDISIKNLINLFDIENKGFITINNIKSMIPLELNDDERDLFAFIQRYAKSNRNFLGYTEFKRFFMPKSNSFNKLFEERNNENKLISTKSIEIIEKLMNKTLEGEKRWRLVSEKLKAKFDYFIEGSYKILDSNNKGFLIIDDLKSFLNTWELFPTNQDLGLLYSRFDRYNEGIVSLRDYLKLMDN